MKPRARQSLRQRNYSGAGSGEVPSLGWLKLESGVISSL